MAERFDLNYETTRQDWLAVNESTMRDGPEWAAASARYRRAMRRQVLFLAPFCVIGAALMVGHGNSTSGMYVEGGALGALFAGFLYFALPRTNAVEKAKREQLKQVERMDLAQYTGPTTVSMNPSGVRVRSAGRDLELAWSAVAPYQRGEFVLLHAGGSTTIVPAWVFPSPQGLAEFYEHALGWWREAQLPPAQRLERYLADRDLPCPKCTYNLRGVSGERCPECGEALRIEQFTMPLA